MKRKKVRFDKRILSATPRNQLPPDENSFEQMRDIMQWFLFFPALIVLIFACAQLALFTSPKVVYADKGSNLQAEYAPWTYLPIGAIRDDILEAIRLDQDLGPHLALLFERPESIVTSWVEDGNPVKIASLPTQETVPPTPIAESTLVVIATSAATNTPLSDPTLAPMITPTMTPTVISTAVTPTVQIIITSSPTPANTDAPPTLVPTNTEAPHTDYVQIDTNGVDSAEGVLLVNRGSITVWVKFLEGAERGDHMILHSDDSRLVLYVDTFFSSGLDRTILSIGARVGGNKIATYMDSVHQGYPEARLHIDNDRFLQNIDYASDIPWIGLGQFPEGEWHHLAMVWKGYPRGAVRLFLDGRFVSQMEYDSRFDDGRALYQMFSVGFKPYSWPTLDQLPTGDLPGSGSLDSGGILINDLRIYQSALSGDKIWSIASMGME